jgi:integrase
VLNDTTRSIQPGQESWEPFLNGIADRVVERLSTAGKVTESLTFGELYGRYSELHVETRCTDAQKRNSYYFFKKHGPRWKDVQVHTIVRRDVQAWVDELATHSQSAATRAVNVVQCVINWGIKRELVRIESNPCKGVDKPADRARDRFVRPAELIKLNASLQSEKPLMRDFFWMCLHTGARRGNVQSMRWDEIDFDLKTWTIPAGKFKNGEFHTIPLVDAALLLLQRRRHPVGNGSPWVFPSPKVRNAHLLHPRKAWARTLNRAGLSGLTIHDLRRTLASYMAINGANQYAIAKMLGHKDMRSTKVYARLDTTAVRREAEAVSEKIKNVLALPISCEPLVLTQNVEALPEKQCRNTTKQLTAVEQVIVEAKILTSINRGGTNKKQFYRTIGSQVQLNKFEMDRVLSEMAERGLIEPYQDDLGNIKYAMK